MKYVKQADTWHTVDDDAKVVPAVLPTPEGGMRRDGRPSLRANCGAVVHMGTFDAPIDDGEHCEACADVSPAVVDPESVDEVLHETIPETLGNLDTEPPQ